MKNKFKDICFDLCPRWLYLCIKWIKTRPRDIKWWIQRANGKMPVCDTWNLDNTLARYIWQGVDRLLNGCIDWDGDKVHKQTQKDLIEIRDFFKNYYEDKYFYYSDENYNDFIKKKNRVFKLLNKHFCGLWD